ncbi:uncharacterized protein BJ171DRAFT_128586 [Polychytrium aggregatum]|uniref:uncharacterized protein n=1 Tax=Polychytrium aggregatum TaxID=110093 RepID=UPI0022FDEF9A|nr:uncharacterized protein BJ171DRAFT_128586 [Polychytrium aggregatum]KAI9204088.1 hypothetical protein BJ171DRAFT_128586 [Polychytrium aggregatum]
MNLYGFSKLNGAVVKLSYDYPSSVLQQSELVQVPPGFAPNLYQSVVEIVPHPVLPILYAINRAGAVWSTQHGMLNLTLDNLLGQPFFWNDGSMLYYTEEPSDSTKTTTLHGVEFDVGQGVPTSRERSTPLICSAASPSLASAHLSINQQFLFGLCTTGTPVDSQKSYFVYTMSRDGIGQNYCAAPAQDWSDLVFPSSQTQGYELPESYYP